LNDQVFTDTFEEKMKVPGTEPAIAAESETPSRVVSDLDGDRAWTSSSRVARSMRACQARNQSGRRRLVDPTTCERDYSAAEMEFMQAIQVYKQQSGRMFPTWSEVLEVLRSLGYEKPVGTDGA
jgi:hypothetical protein